jgi:RNA polymerase sigma-70 factor (ECF subfamily)
MADTHDLVQDALLNTYRQIPKFNSAGQGAFLGYLRRAILNRVSNEIRRVRRNPVPDALTDQQQHEQPSPLERLLGREALERYDRALQALSEQDRTTIIARLELGSSYGELASMLGQSNEAAARKTLERAVKRLAALMSRGA